MAERNVTVRLRAVTDQYKKAMGEASAATSNLVTKAGGMEALGGKMQKVGGTLTRSVTLPMVALGGVASKMSLDFEATFSRMVGLAGVAASEVDGLKDSVLKLAGETTRPPQELAEALYFIRSAGLDGQDALDALEMSAKGAAAGLGDTVTVADAVTSAMNAYGSDVLSAAAATDVLAATAEQGKVEASALAGQFGRLLPVASELGVTFDQVGGAMGFLTRTSGSAELAATQLGGVLAKLLEPGEKGRKTLEKMGMSMDDVRKSVREKGLLVTLEELRNRLAENGMEFSNFAEDQQFLQGALMLTGKSFESAQQTMDAVAGSAGKTEEAFAAFAETAGFKNKQAFAELQSALISIGDVLVPLIADIASFGAAFLGVFNALPGPMKEALVVLGGIIAVTGPLLSIGGKMVAGWGAMSLVFDKAAISAYAAAGALGTMAVAAGAIAAAAAAVYLWVDAMNDAKKAGREQVDTLRDQWLAVEGGEKSIERVRSVMSALDGDIESLSNRIAGSQAPWDADKRAEMKAARSEAEAFRAELAEQEAAIVSLAAELGITEDAAAEMYYTNSAVKDAVNETTGAFDAQAAGAAVLEQQIEDTAKAFSDLSDELAAQFDPLFGAQDAMMDLADAQNAAAEAAKNHGAKSKEAAEANDKVVRAALANEQAMLKLRAAVEADNDMLEEAIGILNRWVAEGRITQEQANKTAASFYGVTDAAKSIPSSVNISVTANIADVLNRLREAAMAVQSFNSSNGTSINVYRGQGSIPQRKVGGAIPGAKGQAVPIMAHGGEMVLSADIVDAIKNGRPTAGLPALAMAGAAGGGGNNYSIVVQALDTRDGARYVKDAILELERSGI